MVGRRGCGDWEAKNKRPLSCETQRFNNDSALERDKKYFENFCVVSPFFFSYSNFIHFLFFPQNRMDINQNDMALSDLHLFLFSQSVAFLYPIFSRSVSKEKLYIKEFCREMCGRRCQFGLDNVIIRYRERLCSFLFLSRTFFLVPYLFFFSFSLFFSCGVWLFVSISVHSHAN